MLPHAANNSYSGCCGSPSGFPQPSRLQLGGTFFLDKYLMVLFGGGVGAMARYVLSSAISTRVGGRFPLGTMVINVTGSFLIGVLMTLFTERLPHPNWRLLLVTGFLGGY